MVTTTNKGLAEPANGDLSWDVPLNANFEAIDKAFGSSVTISLTGLSTYAVSAVQAQNMSLNFSGTPSSDVTVTLPTAVGGQWVVRNGTTKSLTVSSLAGGAGTVTVPTGTIRSIYCDGTNVFFADSQSSGVDDEVAYTSGGVLTGSPDLTFDGTELSVGASASVTSWATGAGTFTATFDADKLVPIGSSVTFSGVTTTPTSPNGFNSTFEVTASTQASGASTVTITETGIGASPAGGAISYGNLKIGGSEVTATAAELNVLDGVTGIASQVQAEAGTDNATLMTPLRVKQAIDANQMFTAGTVTFGCPSANSSATGAHGLGQIPSLVHTYMTCTSADVGYSIGDVVSLSNMASSGTGVYGYTLQISDTNVTMRSANNGFLIVGASNTLVGITPSRWQVTVKCFA